MKTCILSRNPLRRVCQAPPGTDETGERVNQMRIQKSEVTGYAVTITLTADQHELFDIWYALDQQKRSMRENDWHALADRYQSLEQAFDSIVEELFPDKSSIDCA